MDRLLQQAQQYLEWETVAAHKAAVAKLIAEKNEAQLRVLFGKRVAFGTAGLRARMGPGYSQMNELTVIQASQGLVTYLEQTNPQLQAAWHRDWLRRPTQFEALRAAGCRGVHDPRCARLPFLTVSFFCALCFSFFNSGLFSFAAWSPRRTFLSLCCI